MYVPTCISGCCHRQMKGLHILLTGIFLTITIQQTLGKGCPFDKTFDPDLDECVCNRALGFVGNSDLCISSKTHKVDCLWSGKELTYSESRSPQIYCRTCLDGWFKAKDDDSICIKKTRCPAGVLSEGDAETDRKCSQGEIITVASTPDYVVSTVKQNCSEPQHQSSAYLIPFWISLLLSIISFACGAGMVIILQYCCPCNFFRFFRCLLRRRGEVREENDVHLPVIQNGIAGPQRQENNERNADRHNHRAIEQHNQQPINNAQENLEAGIGQEGDDHEEPGFNVNIGEGGGEENIHAANNHEQHEEGEEIPLLVNGNNPERQGDDERNAEGEDVREQNRQEPGNNVQGYPEPGIWQERDNQEEPDNNLNRGAFREGEYEEGIPLLQSGENDPDMHDVRNEEGQAEDEAQAVGVINYNARQHQIQQPENSGAGIVHDRDNQEQDNGVNTRNSGRTTRHDQFNIVKELPEGSGSPRVRERHSNRLRSIQQAPEHVQEVEEETFEKQTGNYVDEQEEQRKDDSIASQITEDPSSVIQQAERPVGQVEPMRRTDTQAENRVNIEQPVDENATCEVVLS